MADNLTPQHADAQDPFGKAREVLNRMSNRRIDPRRIKTTESEPRAKGGQGVIVIGTIIPPEHIATLLPEQLLDALLKVKLAIKKLDWDLGDVEQSAKFFKSFVNELSIRTALSHPNIARFIGFVEDARKGDAWIVSPWEENGNVREFLQSGEWDIPERVSLIKDVVEGVDYLHTRHPPICHGDLKSLNILVNSSYRAVITDFGSARIKPHLDAMKEDSSSKPPRYMNNGDINHKLASPKIQFDPNTLELTLTDAGFSIRWTAPEVLDDGVQGLPSDMWAVGWICWEIVTGKIPFEELYRQGTIIAHVIKGKLPAIREENELSNILMLCDLMSDCWIENPTKRISASNLQRKVSWAPSTVPSGHTTLGGMKIRSAELLQELGTMYGLQGNELMAESHFNSALEVASRTKNPRARANALRDLGGSYCSQSRFHESEKALEEAREIHRQIGDELAEAMVLRGLGETYRGQSRYHDAEKAYREALEIFCRKRNVTGVETSAAKTLSGLAEIYQTQGRYREAEEALREVYKVHTSTGNTGSAAETLVGLGRIRHVLSRGQEAEQTFREALEIQSRVGHDLGMGNALFGLGGLYFSQQRYQEAEHAFNEAYEIFFRISNDLGAADVLNGLGGVYHAQSRFQEAERALRDAYEIHSRIGNVLGTANALSGLGEVYRSQASYQEAECAFKQASEIHSGLGHPLGIGYVFHGLGELYSDQHRYEEALGAFRRAIAAYHSACSDQSRARTLIAIARVYQAKGNRLEAKTSLLEALSIWINTAHDEGQAKASTILAFYESQPQYNEGTEAGAARRAAMLNQLGDLYLEQAKYVDAEEFYCLSQAIYTSISDGAGEARELRNLGKLYGIQGRHEEAVEYFAQARFTSAGIGDRDGEAKALDELMVSSYKQQKFAELRNYCSDALQLCQPMSNILNATLGSCYELYGSTF